MAPLIHELKKRPLEFDSIVAVTAQHREMLDQVLTIFNIEPDYDLNVMKKSQSLAQITTSALNGLDDVLQMEKPDIILVHSDTSTTFAAALAAFYHEIPVLHVAAGLRTWNKYATFPEETNRQLTTVLAYLHFSPTDDAKNNLLKEAIDASKIFVTVNTAIDALKTTVHDEYTHPVLD